MEKIRKIRELVGQAKLSQAIEELLKMNTDYNDPIIAIQRQLTTLKNKELIGIINNQDAKFERNGISYSILQITSTIEADLKKKKKEPNNIHIPDNDGFEKIIEKNGLQRIDWLAKGVEKSKSVCKIHTGDGYIGTGFLVEGNYLYTNNHVINSASVAQYSKIEFGYDSSDNASIFYNLDHNDFITSKELDYTKVKVIDDNNHPLNRWGCLEINAKQPNPNDTLIIIQHPRGRPKEIAFSDNENSIWQHRLHYKVTTEPGSSGSPVFDVNWNVVALHHAGGDLQVNEQGTIKYVNEGILFEYIQSDIAAKQNNVGSNGETSSQSKNKKYAKPIKTVIVYHPLDNSYVEGLSAHLFTQFRNGNMEVFDIHKDIPPQADAEALLNEKINEADMLLTLISNNIYKKETRAIALEVEEMVGKKITIPIKISPFQLTGTPFGKLAGLPRGKSITEYNDDIDSAFYEIAQEISKVIDSLLDV